MIKKGVAERWCDFDSVLEGYDAERLAGVLGRLREMCLERTIVGKEEPGGGPGYLSRWAVAPSS